MRTDTTLERARLERGLTRQQLAQTSGVSYPTIKRIETGRTRTPNDASLIRLARALELPPTTVKRWFPDAPEARLTACGPPARPVTWVRSGS